MRGNVGRAVVVCAISLAGVLVFIPIAPGQTTLSRNPAQVASIPFTAEFKITQVQTLANGTTITRESTRMQATDSQGRTVFATTSTPPYGDHKEMTSVHVDDPVAGTRADWSSLQKKGTIEKLPPEEERHGCWRSETGHLTINYSPEKPRNDSTRSEPAIKAAYSSAVPIAGPKRLQPVLEDLGESTIQGVVAHGQRWTTTTPTGEIGNDQPLVAVSESWNAKDLHLVVRQLSDDPRQGRNDTELVNLTPGEPDPALFQPPEGYEIVTEEMVPCKD